MSSRTYSEVVPFKINVWQGDNEQNTGFESLDHFFRYLELTTYHMERGKLRVLPHFEHKGWELNRGAIIYEGLCPELLTKGDSKVYYVNESKDAAGGSISASFFAEKKSDLEELCDDWSFDASKIRKRKTVQQTL